MKQATDAVSGSESVPSRPGRIRLNSRCGVVILRNHKLTHQKLMGTRVCDQEVS